jgi:hypothetical protein
MNITGSVPELNRVLDCLKFKLLIEWKELLMVVVEKG